VGVNHHNRTSIIHAKSLKMTWRSCRTTRFITVMHPDEKNARLVVDGYRLDVRRPFEKVPEVMGKRGQIMKDGQKREAVRLTSDDGLKGLRAGTEPRDRGLAGRV